MRKRSRVIVTAVAVLAVTALAIPVIASAGSGPGEIVKVKTTSKLFKVGYRGKVVAANANCVGLRKIVLKQKGRGVISHATSNAKGNWTADTVELNEKIKIPAKVFAVVRPSTQATAGPIYKCLKATSKTVVIAGG
jgi:hypothetical protein